MANAGCLVQRTFRLRLLALSALVALSGLGCSNGVLFPNEDAGVCTADDQCPAEQECKDGKCVPKIVCTTDEQCPNESKCEGGYCVPSDPGTCPGSTACVRTSDCQKCMACVQGCCKSTECASDADCPPESGLPRFCPSGADPTTGCRQCNYVRCTDDAQCADPGFPLHKECQGGLMPKCQTGMCACAQPCGGSCPDGTYCCRRDNQCQPIPEACALTICPACEQLNSTPGGVVNETTCAIEGADCSCVPLAPLEPAFAGQHSAMAMGLDGIPVLSGYYGAPYGDLIFGVLSAAEAGATPRWTFVDGVPTGAACEGAEQGPRNGIAAPGDDVGLDTDLAVDADGFARISYFDRTHGALKYAAFDGAAWQIHTVDASGLTGRYTSLELDHQGRPIIAYMALYESGFSALKVAWAQVPRPASLTDWSILTVDAAPVPCLPEACPEKTACIQSGACAALDDPANCAAGCSPKQVCVAGACEDLLEPSGLDDLPYGLGLFASLALFTDGSPAVAYYDATRGNLKTTVWDPDKAAFGTPIVLAGEVGGVDTGDLGVDCDLAVTADNNLHLVYQDGELGELYYLNPAAGAPELVDAGGRDKDGNPVDPAAAVGGLHWVGNFPRVVVDSFGQVRVAYQDGTSLDLVLATRSAGGVWSLEILARKKPAAEFDGAFGFFVDQVLSASGDVMLISNFKHNLRVEPVSSGIDIRTDPVP